MKTYGGAEFRNAMGIYRLYLIQKENFHALHNYKHITF